MAMRTMMSWWRPKGRPMRRRSPSRTMRFGLADWPFTSTLPPSHARFASERVLNRHETSSQTSSRTSSFTLDVKLDLALGLELLDERLRLLLAGALLQELLELRPHLLERDQPGGLLLGDADDVIAELRLDQIARLSGVQRERRGLERRHHLAALEQPEVAALGGAAVL